MLIGPTLVTLLLSTGCVGWGLPKGFLSRTDDDEGISRESGVTELILVQDVTHGYDEHLKALATEGLVRLNAFISEMGWAVKVGLISFQDKPIWPNGNDGNGTGYLDYCAKLHAQPRVDWKKIRSWYGSASSQGGGDPNENQFGALMLAAKGNIFMSDTEKIIVLMTDSEPHFAEDGSLATPLPPFSGYIHHSNLNTQCTTEDYPSYKDVVTALNQVHAHVLFFITDDAGPEGRPTKAWKWFNSELQQDESHVYNLDRRASMFYDYLSAYIAKLRDGQSAESTTTVELQFSSSNPEDTVIGDTEEEEETAATNSGAQSETMVVTKEAGVTLPSLPITYPTLPAVSDLSYSQIELPNMGSSTDPALGGDDSLGGCLRKIGTTLYVPEDPGYHVWNVPYNMEMSPGNPAAVVLPTETEQVSEAVKCAVRYNYTVIPRSGGHDYASYTDGNPQSVVIDLKHLDQWYIDTETGIGMVGAGMQVGVLWHRSLSLTDRFVPTGACTTLGAGGHVLGGGYGFFTRQYGLAVDALTGIEVVLADGSVVVATDSNEPDLFWAMAGSGNGNFGVATKFYIAFKEAPPVVTTISFYWLVTEFPSIMKAAVEFADVIDPKLSFSLTTTQVGVMLKSAYLGTIAEMKEALRPFLLKVAPPFAFYDQGTMLRAATELSIVDLLDAGSPVGTPADQIETLYNKLKEYFGGRTLVSNSLPNEGRKASDPRELGKYQEPTRVYFKPRSLIFNDEHPLTEESIAVMAEAALGGGNPLFGLAIELLGGNGSQLRNETAASRTSWAWRNASWIVHWYSRSYLPLPDYTVDHADALYPKLAATGAEIVYVNYHDRDLTHPLQSYYGPNLNRLEKIKGQYDPTNVFSFGQSVPPPSS